MKAGEGVENCSNTFLALDLTFSLLCRRVAAVSFLSNIAHGDSKTLRLDCLQNTEVEDLEINPPPPKFYSRCWKATEEAEIGDNQIEKEHLR